MSPAGQVARLAHFNARRSRLDVKLRVLGPVHGITPLPTVSYSSGMSAGWSCLNGILLSLY